jgi:type I restriction enzyme, S subunit
MVNGKLPDGWAWKKIEEIADTTSGGTPLRSRVEYYGGNIPWVKSGELPDGIIREVEEKITEAGLKNSSAKLFPKDTVVVALYGATVGRTGILGIDATTNQAVCGIFPRNHSFISKFMFYWLQSQRQNLINQSMGGAQPNISQGIIRSLSFPLAPLPEQERIVAKIEELFTQLDAGTSALERVRAGLRRYKASVLKDAFEGKLVPQQESGESVKELLDRVIGKDYEKKIAPSASSKVPFVPSGWVYGKLENLIYIAGRIGWRGLKADEYTEDGPMFLSVYNLNKGDHVDFSETYHISQERYDESPEIMLRENDILLAKDGAGIGKIGIVKGLPGLATVNSSLLVIRSSEIFVPEFLFYFLKGPQMQDVVRARITGSATPHLFQRDIRQFTLLIPPLEEQRRIVAEVERRLSVARQVESAVEEALVRASRLRQAVLRSAFEGRLA